MISGRSRGTPRTRQGMGGGGSYVSRGDHGIMRIANSRSVAILAQVRIVWFESRSRLVWGGLALPCHADRRLGRRVGGHWGQPASNQTPSSGGGARVPAILCKGKLKGVFVYIAGSTIRKEVHHGPCYGDGFGGCHLFGGSN